MCFNLWILLLYLENGCSSARKRFYASRLENVALASALSSKTEKKKISVRARFNSNFNCNKSLMGPYVPRCTRGDR